AIALSFSIWLLGCGALYVALNLDFQSQAVALGIFGLGIFLTLGLLIAFQAQWIAGLSPVVQDFVLALGVAASFVGAAKLKSFAPSSILGKLSLLFSRPSYSLYLLHLPFLVFIASRLFHSDSDRWIPDRTHLLYGLILAGSCGL